LYSGGKEELVDDGDFDFLQTLDLVYELESAENLDKVAKV